MGKSPLPHRYRKRYPAERVVIQKECSHASIGIENDTQHTMWKPPPEVVSPRQHGYRKRYPRLKENSPRPHRYRKRYPAHNGGVATQRNYPTLTRVSKTIPGRKSCHPEGKLSCKHRYRKRYPAHNGGVATRSSILSPTRVSKTIPTT